LTARAARGTVFFVRRAGHAACFALPQGEGEVQLVALTSFFFDHAAALP
jgi:hypothetical protein